MFIAPLFSIIITACFVYYINQRTSLYKMQCVAEKVRGKKDWVNGSLGGVAAGSVLGLRSTFLFFSYTYRRIKFINQQYR